MFDGCARSWSVESPRIVGVFPVRDRVQLVAAGDLIIDPAEQLLFAVKATIWPVRLILRSITFMSHHLNERYADLACNFVRRTPFLGRQTGGDSQQRNDALVRPARALRVQVIAEESTPPEKATPSRWTP